MNRDLQLIIITDVNNAESRTLLSSLNEDGVIPRTILTPQSIKNIIPCIRATPAVGVLLWATDLQGLASDVDAFSEYIKNEAENKQSLVEANEIAQAYVDMLADSLISENNMEV